MTTNEDIAAAMQRIEETRKEQHRSVAKVTKRTPGISATYWRQFANGGVPQGGVWVPRTPTVEQVLLMAEAVGIREDIASMLDVDPGADTNPYTDPVEHAIWSLTDLPEEERRALIDLLRARRRHTG